MSSRRAAKGRQSDKPGVGVRARLAATRDGSSADTLRLVWILTAACGATALTLVTLAFALPPGYARDFVFDRSLIQHASIALFWVTMTTLASKHWDHRTEAAAHRRAAEILEGPEIGQQLIWSHAPEVREQFCQGRDQRFHGTVVFRRIVRALERLHASQSTKAMEDYFRARSDFDAAELDTAYTGVRYCVWLLPTLGFVGTVLGIGVALAEFAAILPELKELTTVQQELPGVTKSLGTAFDTTLLALLLSVIAVYYMSFVLKQQEQLLERNDGLCFDGVCSRFQEHSTASESIIRAIHENVEQISERMNGNRGAVEQMMREEVPVLVANGVAAPLQSLEKSIVNLLQSLAASLVTAADTQTDAHDRLTAELRRHQTAQAQLLGELQTTLQEVRDLLSRLATRPSEKGSAAWEERRQSGSDPLSDRF